MIMLGGIFLGWALGSNDGANVFGTAVGSRIIRYRTAAVLAAIFVIIGALLEGGEGIKGVSALADQTPGGAFIVTVSAALTVTVMTGFKLPVSATQAVVGAIIGMGLLTDPSKIEWYKVWKMVLCWLGTPTLAAFLSFVLHPLIA